MSRPSRARGLKSASREEIAGVAEVAPFTGAWIEIVPTLGGVSDHPVAPFTGAWIEMDGASRLKVVVYGRALHGRVD